MSKPTILILSIVYLASVLIVGIFGMQVMSFNNVNYIESITINLQEVEFSDNQIPVILKEDESDNPDEKRYTILCKYSNNLTIFANPIIIAKDPTLDATNRNLRITKDNNNDDSIIYENGVFKVNKIPLNNSVEFTFYSQDSSNKFMTITLIVVK